MRGGPLDAACTGADRGGFGASAVGDALGLRVSPAIADGVIDAETLDPCALGLISSTNPAPAPPAKPMINPRMDPIRAGFHACTNLLR